MNFSVYCPNFFTKTAGGVKTFIQNIRRQAQKNNFNFLNTCDSAKVLFIISEYDLNFIKRAKACGTKILQRLDGIYYSSKHGNKHQDLNFRIKYIYENLADYVVFQSYYSKQQCTEIFGKCKVNSSIVINGVDKQIFAPNKGTKSHDLVFITTGNFRHESMLKPILKALQLLDQKYSFEFRIIGPINKECTSLIKEYNFCKYMGEKNHIDLAYELSKSDIFLYSFCNPPCPNSIIEAISVGVPIVGFKTGAMEELCFFNSNLLVDMPKKTIHLYADFDYLKLSQKIEQCIYNLDSYKKISLSNTSCYDLNTMFNNYIDLFTRLQNESNVDSFCSINAQTPSNITDKLFLKNTGFISDTKKFLNYYKEHNIFRLKKKLELSNAADSYETITSMLCELSSACNLKCKFCSQQFKSSGEILSKDIFLDFIKKMPPNLKFLTLHFSGEAFLNKNISEFISIIKKFRIFTTASTNGMAPLKRYISSINAGLDTLIFAIDGYYPSTHQKYRIGSSLDTIYNNLIQTLLHRKNGSKVGVQFLVTHENEDEITKLAHFLTRQKADFFNLKTLSLNIAGSEKLQSNIYYEYKNWLPQNKSLSRYDINIFRKINLKFPIKVCPYIFQPVLRANGAISLCCIDIDGQIEIGNLIDYQNFASLWNSKNYREIRRAALLKELPLCKNCNFSQLPLISVDLARYAVPYPM